VVRILIIIESPLIEDEVLYSAQQVALNPTNMFRLSSVNEYVTVSGWEIWILLYGKNTCKAHPPGIVSIYLGLPNSFFSQLIKIVNSKIEINVFLI
jgi:hypothetical protein